MKYSPKYFFDNIPEWKRQKDPILSRFFYRPLSFVTASVCANAGISANSVSYFSAVVAIAACVLFMIPSFGCRLAGAVLVNIWLLLDCTDGNLARSVKKQAFGEFADGISSYILVGFLCTAMGMAVYHNGGILVEHGTVWIVLAGTLASSSDTMMRLIYQKYKATERELADAGVIQIEKDIRTDHSQVSSFRVRVEAELGIGGILPALILAATILNALDLIVIYCLLYYGASCVVASLLYIRKAVKAAKENPIQS